jgi:MFS family permease
MAPVEPEHFHEQTAALGAPDVGRTLGILRRNPDFTKLYVAQLISFGGDWFTSVALLALVLEKTGSATLAALVFAAQTIPFAIVSPFAGVIVDRFDRKAIMIAADVIRALLALGFVFAQTPGTIWVIFLLLALISGLSAFFEPASSAALPNLVSRADLARANVLIGSAWGTMLVVGAALGGLVAVHFGNTAGSMNGRLIGRTGSRSAPTSARPSRSPGASITSSLSSSSKDSSGSRRASSDSSACSRSMSSTARPEPSDC